MSSAGDINNDGIEDLIIGAPSFEAGGAGDSDPTSDGRAYVVFGKDEPFDAELDLSNLGTDGFVITRDQDDGTLGFSVSSAGDVNGDGIDDLIIGAPTGDSDFDNVSNTPGASYVVFGKDSNNCESFGPALNLSSLDADDGFVINGAAAGDFAGSAVSAAGDINGDGIGDLIIGAPGANDNGDLGPAGATYVLFGGTDIAGADLASIVSGNGSNGFVVNGVEAGNFLGASVSAAGDVNGDGLDDLIIGTFRNIFSDSGQSTEGFSQSYVIFGREGSFGSSLDLNDLGGNGFALNGARITAPDFGGNFLRGSVVSAAGDVNDDGFDDLIVADRNFADGTGIVSPNSYVIFGSSSLGFGPLVE